MAKRADRLLAQIEQDVLDDSKPLASALRKCVILGGHAGSADLREWATRELQGYRSEDDKLPDYRYIAAPLLIDGVSGHYKITGEQISVLDLPEIARDVVKDDMQMRLGIGEIEAMIRQAEAEDGFVWPCTRSFDRDTANGCTGNLGAGRRRGCGDRRVHSALRSNSDNSTVAAQPGVSM